VTAQIFDAKTVRRHRDRAAKLMPTIAPVLENLAAQLLDRLDDTATKFQTALDLGGRGAIAPVLKSRGLTVISADLSAQLAATAGGLPVTLTGEALPFAAQQFDLIIAHLCLHWIDDLPGALIQLRHALKPGGLFLASLPLLGTLHELRTALLAAEHALTGAVNPRISPFPDLRDTAALLQRAGFRAPVADAQDIEFLYASPLALLHELRAAGETNATLARSRKFTQRTLFPAALATLPSRDGRIIATLKLGILTGWAS